MNTRLDCFVMPGWDPKVFPAQLTREWMEKTPEKFAYRCLPLAIANQHGWEILSPCSFQVMWNGYTNTDGLIIQLKDEDKHHVGGPVSVFGHGVLTFHIAGIFRTSPGWNLYITGSPNMPKDAVYPLTGVVETDWAPFTFTMNHKITRTNTIIHYDKDEPICFVFPVQRTLLEEIEPKVRPMSDDPDLQEQFFAWQNSRNAFHEKMKTQPVTGGKSWQKNYFHGKDMNDVERLTDHRTKLRLKPFNK